MTARKKKAPKAKSPKPALAPDILAMCEQYGLTGKQATFVKEYLVDLNASQAAIRAGYSRKTAFAIGHENLRKPKLAEAVRDAMQARSEKLDITAESVLRELAKMGFANMADYMRVGPDGDPYLDFGELTRDQAAALVEVTVEDFKDGRGDDARDVRRVKFKLGDKKGALELLGKHLILFTERTINENLNWDVTDEPISAEEWQKRYSPGG